MKFNLNISMILIVIGLMSSNVAWALPLVDKIIEIARAPNLSPDQKVTGTNTLMSIVVDCEFDEGCLLKQMVPIKELFEKEKNPMYVEFDEYLFKNKESLEKASKNCNLEDKKAARKIYALCYRDALVANQSMTLTTRDVIDKFEDHQEVCVKLHMEKLAEQRNIFAQAVMVNLYQEMGDTKKMDYWYNQIQKQSSSKQYQDLQSCPEVP
jgi:hypothetical protein